MAIILHSFYILLLLFVVPIMKYNKSICIEVLKRKCYIVKGSTTVDTAILSKHKTFVQHLYNVFDIGPTLYKC